MRTQRVLEAGNSSYGHAFETKLWLADEHLCKTPPILCESVGSFRHIIEDELKRWNDFSGSSTFLISLDGLSGSGKSSLSTEIRSVTEQLPGIGFYPVPIDLFIATPRDSSLRARMTESRELFWRLIYDRQSMIDVLTCIVRANGEPCSVYIPHHYNRVEGSVGPAVMHVPAGRKVALVDGIDATRILQTLETIAPCPQLRVLLFTSPYIALERAAQRDAKQGRRALQEGREYRRREFAYLVPQIFNANSRQVEVIFVGR